MLRTVGGQLDRASGRRPPSAILLINIHDLHIFCNIDRLEIEKLDELALAKAVSYPPTGFAGLTRRNGKKPMIAACNGHAHGGGFEIILNCDLVIAAEHADFKLPDSARGTGALCGGLPRLVRILTLQRAMLMALTTYTLPAKEAMEWGLVQKIVPADDLIKEAVKMGSLIASMSPDSVIVNRAGIREGWETGSVEHASTLIWDNYAKKLMLGENAIEGMQAFKEKRRPVWKPSKL